MFFWLRFRSLLICPQANQTPLAKYICCAHCFAVCIKQSSNVFWIKPWLRLIARAEHVVAWNRLVRSDCVVMRTNAPRTRSRTRVCKNQKISLHFSRASSPHPSAAKRKKKWKGNFWFCFAVSDYKMNTLIIAFVVLWRCSFLRPHGETRHFLSAFGGSLKLCGFVH